MLCVSLVDVSLCVVRFLWSCCCCLLLLLMRVVFVAAWSVLLLLECAVVRMLLLFAFCVHDTCWNCVFDVDVLLFVFVVCFVGLFVCLFVRAWCV